MRDYLSRWANTFANMRGLAPAEIFAVLGEHTIREPPQHAEMRVRVEPSENLEIDDTAVRQDELAYAEWGVFGLLDILLPAGLSQVRLVCEAVVFDPVASSRMAFRLAGRDAARKILARIKEAR